MSAPPNKVAAFFDMDYTLVAGNTVLLYVRFLRRHGLAKRGDLLKTLWWSLQYRLGTIDMRAVVSKVVGDLEGDAEAAMADTYRRWYDADVRSLVAPEGRRTVEYHRAQGHPVVLLTGSSAYASAPVAEDLGLDDVLCTRFGVDDAGLFTGRLVEPPCYGQGKVVWAERYALENGIDLDRSYFYTDSHTDLPMLARVGEPRPVNADARLRRHARRAGWETVVWSP